jgi:hypothetical protein
MDIKAFEKELHMLFENVDYSAMFKEAEVDNKQSLQYTSPTDGKVYEVKYEPVEKEFYVYQDGKQVDLFNPETKDTDTKLSKMDREAIIKQASAGTQPVEQTPSDVQQPSAVPEELPVAETVQKVEEMNKDILANMRQQYPDLDEKELISRYYATMNAHNQDPETGKKI